MNLENLAAASKLHARLQVLQKFITDTNYNAEHGSMSISVRGGGLGNREHVIEVGPEVVRGAVDAEISAICTKLRTLGVAL